MSEQAVQIIIGRAVMDSEFRKWLFSDPAQALVEYDLTMEEVASLITLDAESMETFVGSLDERVSKSILGIFY
ncbi:MAG: Franean1_4349 family RiPP [Anaerolineae bacterium]|nr:Franean1_4349 family RiPP [Anaerolineae bacterium]